MSSALRNLSYEIVMGNLSEVTGSDQDKLNLLKLKSDGSAVEMEE